MRDPELTVEADDDTSLPEIDDAFEDDHPATEAGDSGDGDSEDPWEQQPSDDVSEVIAADSDSDPDVDSDSEVPSEFVATTRWVPLGTLRIEYKFWTNPRRFTGLDSASIEDLGADIASKTRQVMSDGENTITYAGIDDPLLVVRIQENGGVVDLVIDGQRRERAARQAYREDGDVLVPVRYLEPEPVVWTQALSNRYLSDSLRKVGLRAGLSAFELARNAEFLRGQRDEDTGKDYTLEKIAGLIGRSESWVSKILTALGRAAPKLIHRWETGQITEEQFRDLAATKDPEQQTAAADAVVQARASGDSAGGRTLAKEQLELARARAKPAKEDKASPKDDKPGKAPKGKGNPVVRGPQGEFPAPPPRKPPPFSVVEDMLDTAGWKPPTSDYVKGMLDGVRWASGLLDAASLGKPWQSYLRHVTGAKDDAKPSRAGKTTKPAKKKSK
jgi:ParB-like chromosome segregation protein Spo0J